MSCATDSDKKQENQRRGYYIVSSFYDSALIIGAPLIALALGFFVAQGEFFQRNVQFGYQEGTVSGVAIGVVIHAHLFAVLFRTHGNKRVFLQFRARFVLVPLLLYVLIISSTWAIVVASVVATFWDVYHSGAQTFGFGRIYDAKRGNSPLSTRRLDFVLNQVLYAGPIVAGAVMLDHFEAFEEFSDVDAVFLTTIPAKMLDYSSVITQVVVSLGGAFLVAYLYLAFQAGRAGYRHSPQKIILYLSTGACSIYAWGFNSWGEAFFIMNFFHAVQYFAIVWAIEKKSIRELFFLGNVPGGSALALAALLVSTGLYGAFVESFEVSITQLWAITLVVSLMHFWYDGFVWSVRKNAV